MAESKGFFGVLPYAFASLRSLTTDFQTVHRTVFIGEADRPCSNPLLKITQRKTRHSKRYTLFSWRRARDSAHFVRRKVCYANYPDYRLLLTRLRLAKDCKGSNPINNSQKNKRHSKRYTLFSWRRARDSAHFVRRKVCYANYPDYRLLLTRLRLAKDCKGSNPINNSQKK